jgi:hypothetical protein
MATLINSQTLDCLNNTNYYLLFWRSEAWHFSKERLCRLHFLFSVVSRSDLLPDISQLWRPPHYLAFGPLTPSAKPMVYLSLQPSDLWWSPFPQLCLPLPSSTMTNHPLWLHCSYSDTWTVVFLL